MTKIINNFLHFVNYQDIPNWSVQYADEEDLGFTKKYPMARIGSFLVKSRDVIEVQDHIEYKQVTIKINNGGVVPRKNGEAIKGLDIGTKRQHVVHAGQFIMSKIDARNGAYGIVPKELEGAIVTNDFPVFDVDTEKMHPLFLVLISTTENFIEFARKCSSGTTNRKRINIDAFLNQQIPLPSIKEQEDIVKEYHTALKETKTIEAKILIEEKACLEYWVNSLGIDVSSRERVIDGKLSFTKLSSISKWGVDFINDKKKQEQFSKYYKSFQIKDICKIGSGGTPSRGNKRYYLGNIPWIKTGELDDNIITDTEEKITQEAVDNSSAKLYPANCIIMAMYGATIGKTAKLGIEATTNQACAVLYNIDHSFVDTDFLWFYLQTQTNKFKELAYGGAQPNINAGIVANYLIPIPPMAEQLNMVEHTKNTRILIQSLRNEIFQKTLGVNNLINSILFK
jgi:type I restriction enzyme S subunit